jgi:hypothetical protein
MTFCSNCGVQIGEADICGSCGAPSGFSASSPLTSAHPVGSQAATSKSILIWASVVLVGFFLPWFQAFGLGMSGYQIGNLGSYGNYVWVIPILCGATIFMGLTGADNRLVGGLAGLVPIGAIIYALAAVADRFGGGETQKLLEIAHHVLSIGAYLTILGSLGLLAGASQSPLAPISKPTQMELPVTDRDPLRSAYLIQSTIENGLAQLAGVRVGDLLIEYNGHPITSDQSVSDAVSSLATKTARILVIRGTEARAMTINAGRLGIDGCIGRLDDNSYKTRCGGTIAHQIPMPAIPVDSGAESTPPGSAQDPEDLIVPPSVLDASCASWVPSAVSTPSYFRAMASAMGGLILLCAIGGGGYWYYQIQAAEKNAALMRQRMEERRLKAEADAKADEIRQLAEQVASLQAEKRAREEQQQLQAQMQQQREELEQQNELTQRQLSLQAQVLVDNRTCWPQDIFVNGRVILTIPAESSRSFTVPSGSYGIQACTASTSVVLLS